jgi:hypothetical protein
MVHDGRELSETTVKTAGSLSISGRAAAAGTGGAPREDVQRPGVDTGGCLLWLGANGERPQRACLLGGVISEDSGVGAARGLDARTRALVR